MSGLFNTVMSYLGFYTSGSPAPVTATTSDGSVTITVPAGPTPYISPNVSYATTVIGLVTLGRAAGTVGGATVTAALPASFTDIPLHTIDFNPPISSFSVSKITRVTIRAPPAPVDVNWYAGIWAPLASTGRTFDAVRRRAPNVAWVWRSNVTVQQAIEHEVPWPLGKPVMDSLHATLPGLHAPSLQIGFENQPFGTATAASAGAFVFTVIVDLEVAGTGMIGTI